MVTPEPPDLHTGAAGAERHLAPDLLVGWAEGGLLDAEAAQAEAHLAVCDVCRALVADLSSVDSAQPEVAPDPFAEPAASPAGAPSPGPRLVPEEPRGQAIPEPHEDEIVHRGHVGMWEARFKMAFLAAAGLILMTLLTRGWRDDRPRVEWAASAGSAAELFGEIRSGAAPTEELFVGLAFDREAHLRLLAVLDDGSLMAVPLDTQGSFSLPLESGAEFTFGPYPRAIAATGGGENRRVRWFLALVSGEAVEVVDEAEPWWFTIHKDLRVRTRQELEQLGVRLEDAHGAETAIITID